MTGVLPPLGVGAFIAGSTSGGQITPAVSSSFWLRLFWLACWRSCGVQPVVSAAYAVPVMAPNRANAKMELILIIFIASSVRSDDRY